MPGEANRVQMTIRLKESDKDFLAAGAEQCGIEAGVAARQILELVVQRMRAGGDYIDALHELKSIWSVPREPANDVAPSLAQRRNKRFPRG